MGIPDVTLYLAIMPIQWAGGQVPFWPCLCHSAIKCSHSPVTSSPRPQTWSAHYRKHLLRVTTELLMAGLPLIY